jgi:hypothetical protein
MSFRLRDVSLALTLTASLASLAACGGAPEPNAPDGPEVENQARVAYERAKDKEDPQGLLDVYHRFPQAASGKKALYMGVDRMSTQAEKLAKACKDDEARKLLTEMAGYVADEPAIDSKVDALKEKVEKYKRKCTIDALDADVDAAAKDLNWPKAFEAIDDDDLAKNLDAKTIGRKRDEVKKRWLGAIDGTLADIVKRRSAALVVDEHRKGWLASIDPKSYPEDLQDDIKSRAAKIAGVMLVFDKLEGGSLVDPPAKYWTFGDVKVRVAGAPETEGKELPQGLPFNVVAQGKLGNDLMLAVGKPDGDEMARLSSITFLVPQKAAKTWDTRMLLPTTLVGARVFGPSSPGNRELALYDVVEEKDGAFYGTPVGKTNKVKLKKTELRAFYVPAGTKVTVSVNYAWRKGETTAEATDGDTIAVRVNGADSQAKASDVHVDRDALPKIPND